jgi:hypothetical protein
MITRFFLTLLGLVVILIGVPVRLLLKLLSVLNIPSVDLFDFWLCFKMAKLRKWVLHASNDS